ncbi:hypothetical protein LIER_14656 [Lithospermum erythrorhizon]|uniref:CCHC-type domain-containing protein n=1 Tax=Lithospermum erythrorhizon TaxID=34254 RepID=A0AAV3Q568_LITER
MYEKLLAHCNKLTGLYMKQEKENKRLLDENNEMLIVNSGLNEKVEGLNAELEAMKKSVHMLNSGTSKLDEILSLGQSPNDHTGVGYVAGECSKESKFIPAAKVKESQLLYQLLPTAGLTTGRPHVEALPKNKRKKKWICHHCGKKGHIRPYCYKLYGRNIHQHGQIPHIQNSKIAHHKEWRVKRVDSGVAQHKEWKIKNDYRGNSCVANRKVWKVKRDLRGKEKEANVVSIPNVHARGELDMCGANGQAGGSTSVNHSCEDNELQNSSFVVRWIDFLRQKGGEM